ncbi:golgin subfamily A member 1 isoform X1 [Salvelinus namaycush]|uniref:Golgin subfamily A member 1 n=1 Tax=Salvelinus namaycush TaxID=8040 RepID=A0A8U1BT83_SALNM|nr:golgin subfamily A member 1 isoform X1 [Salvelinus namaycush]XP_038863134.1 golgin subfamily A member 1 isoform X1 [Salvelinus namaycush]
MFAKLKKKIAEEAATAPRTGVRMLRSYSKESITSVGADSGDDFASDGSSSRDDLSSQILRRNDQIRKLEAKLSDYAEQLRLMQKTKDKLEIALEKHQDSSMRKLQDQNETHQANRAKMAEGMALALDKKDQEWMERISTLEQEKASLSVRLDDMMEQSLTLFQKRDDLDELEGFQQQELAKVKHMLLSKEEQLVQRERVLHQKGAELQMAKKGLAEAQEQLRALGEEHQESCRLNTELEMEREELLEVREEAEKKISELEGRGQNLQKVIQQVSEDFQKSQSRAAAVEKSLRTLQIENNALKLEQHKAAVTDEDKERVLLDLQEKNSSLERRLHGNLSEDELLQELLKEKSTLEQRLEDTRVELLEARTNHADTVSSLETQISRLNNNVTELQTLLRHKDDSSKNYRERTDAQIAGLEQQVQESNERLKNTEQQISDKQAHLDKLQAEWSVERDSLQQQVSAERQQGQERAGRLEEQLTALQTERDTEHTSAQARISELEQERASLLRGRDKADVALRRQAEELEQARSELSSRQTVSVEIAMALEDTRRQKEELQLQVVEMMASLQTTSQELAHVTEQLKRKEEDLQTLRNELQSAQSSLSQLQEEGLQAAAQERQEEKDSQLVSLRQELLTQNEQLDSCQLRVSELEVEVETLTLQQTPELCELDQNGTVTVDDLDHMQKANRDLEQQLSDKNKTIKQLQQRLAELKRTLQKELKLKPETESDGKERAQEGRGERQERPDRIFTEPAPGPAPGPNTTVTNTSDLNDSREINFEYLKHVVLKFMSSREAEAYQLIRAVSVLLNFTGEEEDMLKQTLEYKMSWFGSKPSPKGIVRPSVSGAPAHWS